MATAKRLGAVVSAIDIRPAAAEQAKSVGAKPIDTGVPAEIAIGEGGYAQRLPEEWLEKERERISDVVKSADILITAALIPGKLAPILVTGGLAGEPSGAHGCGAEPAVGARPA